MRHSQRKSFSPHHVPPRSQQQTSCPRAAAGLQIDKCERKHNDAMCFASLRLTTEHTPPGDIDADQAPRSTCSPLRMAAPPAAPSAALPTIRRLRAKSIGAMVLAIASPAARLELNVSVTPASPHRLCSHSLAVLYVPRLVAPRT